MVIRKYTADDRHTYNNKRMMYHCTRDNIRHEKTNRGRESFLDLVALKRAVLHEKKKKDG